jgi:hypothetical protein
MKPRLGKFGTVLLAVTLALAVAGAGFAKWSDTVVINGDVSTGTVCWHFVSGSFFQHDSGLDETCEPGLINVSTLDKDVGNTTGYFQDDHMLVVTINNAYPCYYNEISAKEQICGTIPVVLQAPVLTYASEDYTLPSGVVVTTNDGVLEFRWMDNTGQQFDPGGGPVELSFEMHVLQPAPQSTAITFTITQSAVQWNEA